MMNANSMHEQLIHRSHLVSESSRFETVHTRTRVVPLLSALTTVASLVFILAALPHLVVLCEFSR
jgi:hypothetical protein